MGAEGITDAAKGLGPLPSGPWGSCLLEAAHQLTRTPYLLSSKAKALVMAVTAPCREPRDRVRFHKIGPRPSPLSGQGPKQGQRDGEISPSQQTAFKGTRLCGLGKTGAELFVTSCSLGVILRITCRTFPGSCTQRFVTGLVGASLRHEGYAFQAMWAPKRDPRAHLKQTKQNKNYDGASL